MNQKLKKEKNAINWTATTLQQTIIIVSEKFVNVDNVGVVHHPLNICFVSLCK